MPYSLILVIFLLTPIGESPVVQEIKAEFPVSRAVAACQKRTET